MPKISPKVRRLIFKPQRATALKEGMKARPASPRFDYEDTTKRIYRVARFGSRRA